MRSNQLSYPAIFSIAGAKVRRVFELCKHSAKKSSENLSGLPTERTFLPQKQRKTEKKADFFPDILPIYKKSIYFGRII